VWLSIYLETGTKKEIEKRRWKEMEMEREKEVEEMERDGRDGGPPHVCHVCLPDRGIQKKRKKEKEGKWDVREERGNHKNLHVPLTATEYATSFSSSSDHFSLFL
jgi:hypothetical protein